MEGRRARSVRTRLAIINALRSLHEEGNLRPTAARVAERGGVSLRTVWHHFADFESLLVEAGERDFELLREYMTPIDAGQPLPTRLRQFVSQRARIYETFAPVWRAARLQEPFSPQIRRSRDRLYAVARSQLQTVFATELERLTARERAPVFNALQQLSSWTAWEGFRTELHLSVSEAEHAVMAGLAALTRAADQLYDPDG
jgi:AcrR family transcriptional regulator